jgi:hypothetical protein
MVEVPASTPVTIPVLPTIVATVVVPLAQTPPDGELVSVVVNPSQTVNVPDIVPGIRLTETIWVTKQPVVSA